VGGVTGATVAAATLTVADALPDPPLPVHDHQRKPAFQFRG